ncbi:MAG: DNA translocase FtsK [Ruminococcus sp.]|jgi:S-DNA-T family DNA segregation ATPase FtsK/SpoIIIE|nr:DNA translocase FtsK [Ruminococcus sp.]
MKQKSAVSVILFAAGLLLFAFAVVPGESAWLFVHNIMLGMFSLAAYIIPFIFIYVSIIIAGEEVDVQSKTVQCLISIFLLTACLQIILVGSLPEGDFFGEILPTLFEEGKELRGGGVCGVLLSGLLLLPFGKTGATIIILLVIFAYVMILTNKSVADLFAAIKRFFGIFRTHRTKAEEAPAKAVKIPEKKEEFVPSPGAKKVAPSKEPEAVKVKKEERRKKFNFGLIDGLKPSDVVLVKDSETPTEELPKEEFSGEMLPFDLDEPPKLNVTDIMSGGEISNTPVEKDTTVDNSSASELEQIVKKAAEEKMRRDSQSESGNITALRSEDFDEKKHSTLASNKITDPKELNMPEMLTAADIQKEIETPAAAKVYIFPPLNLLNRANNELLLSDAEAEMKQNADTLVETLKSFGVQTRIVDIHRGPTVTRYELQPAAGVKISKITGLSDDIALNLAAAGVRIEAPIPGKAAVGVEVPNKIKDIVAIRELIESEEFARAKSKLSFVVGKNIDGDVIVGDIGKMPHIIIAGTTGSGKSVCTNSIIMSILYNSSPDDVRMVLIDPKMVEFKTYDGIPHLLIPVVTDPRKAAGALSWAVQEMLKRYQLFADRNVRDLAGYNEAAIAGDFELLPRIVIVIDELADLMMAAANEVEDSICRLAQMARAAGMHLIIATQRPTVDVITGLIKANIPSRIALTVSSQIDSRTIIDTAGAEKLLGNGDMLYYPSGIPKPVRVQGCYVSTKEVEAVVDFIKNASDTGLLPDTSYSDEIMREIEKNMPAAKTEKVMSSDSNSEEITDGDLFDRATEVLIDAGQASVSYLQRKLKLGYARAARIMDDLEEAGVVGPYEGAKPRSVLISREQWLQKKLTQNDRIEE